MDQGVEMSIYCEVCGNQNATESQEQIEVGHEFVTITVISCPDCELIYTDYRAEDVRTNAG